MRCFLQVGHPCSADLTIYRMHVKNESSMWTMNRRLSSFFFLRVKFLKLEPCETRKAMQSQTPFSFSTPVYMACRSQQDKWGCSWSFSWDVSSLYPLSTRAGPALLLWHQGPLGWSTSQILSHWRVSKNVSASLTHTKPALMCWGWGRVTVGTAVMPSTCICEPK